MKKILIVTFLILNLFEYSFSQQEPLIRKYIYSFKNSPQDAFKVYEEMNYEYDFWGNLSSKNKIEYDGNDNIIKWNTIFYNYNSNQLLIKETNKRYNPDVDLWITEDWIDYKYNQNKCLVEEIQTQNVGGYTEKIYYELNDNCQWIVKKIETPDWRYDNTFLISSKYERFFFPDNISYEEKKYMYDYIGDSLYLERTNIFVYNENKNISEYYFILNQSTSYYEDKYTYEYDEYHNLIHRKGYNRQSITGDWDYNYVFNFYNEYDEKEFLIKKREEFVSFNSGVPSIISSYSKINKYKNSCDGFPEIIENERLDFGSKLKEEFIYEGINECFDIEKTDLSLQIYPNPSNGYFEINSPIFESGNTEIIAYSIDGKVLLQKMENSRATNSFIDLSLLQNGIYILQLGNGNHFVKEKIVIAK